VSMVHCTQSRIPLAHSAAVRDQLPVFSTF
jgi:hypothetical protein